VKRNEKDDEFISLVQSIHAQNIPGHPYRGYQILGEAEEREVEQHTGERRPVWYVFSGMGSQWPGMGKALMSIPTFAESLRRCAAVLRPSNVDLMSLILNGSDESFEDVLNSFIAIAAIQVALVDVLTMLGIHPDGMIGHSVGEVGCAYADGTFTTAQTILAAYLRGKSIKESQLPDNMGESVASGSFAYSLLSPSSPMPSHAANACPARLKLQQSFLLDLQLWPRSDSAGRRPKDDARRTSSRPATIPRTRLRYPAHETPSTTSSPSSRPRASSPRPSTARASPSTASTSPRLDPSFETASRGLSSTRNRELPGYYYVAT
jgi:hypothetical protein